MKRRISASRLNAIDQCTMKFYLHEFLGLPEKIWPRTHAGTATHSVLEALARQKHINHLNTVIENQTIYSSPAISRLVKKWQEKTKMADDIVADIDGMCMVAINHSNFLDKDATEVFEPEHEFKLTLSNSIEVKGFIDRLARYGDKFIIKDYKTAREKFSKAEVQNSYQSLTYQLYIWKKFGCLSEVQYYFLRHPPTKRTPEKHVMITPPATPQQLLGFEKYLEYMGSVVNSFGLEEAHSGYCSDQGFCDRVCSYRNPMKYFAVIDNETKQVLSTHMIDNPPKIEYNQRLEERFFRGCDKFN